MRRQMNPRQRQGMLLVMVAAVGLVGVFLLIANYVSTISRQVGPKVTVLTLTQNVAAYTPVTSSDLGQSSVPAKWAPADAIGDPSEVLGEVSQVPLSAGTELQRGMLSAPPALTPGQREIAIYVNPETGVAGQVTPGALVDLIATYQPSASQGKPSAQVVVAGAKVLNIGQLDSANGQQATVPVTLALTPEQAQEVSYADSFAAKLRLSLVAPGTVQLADPPPYTGPQTP